MRLFKLLSLAAVVSALIPLAACETLGLSSPSTPAYPDEQPAVAAAAPVGDGQPCPGSAVLSEASRVTFVRPSGTTTADIIMSAEMSPPRLECEYDAATRVDNIDLNFPLVLTKGAAATSDEGQITYFVALVNTAGEVIAKKVFQRRIVFQGKQSFIATEKVENLVLTLGPGTRPTDHRLLIGFQLTNEQLAFNRAGGRLPPPAPPVVAAPPPPPPTPAATPAATPAPAPSAAATPATTPAPTPSATTPPPSTATAPPPASAAATPAPAPAPAASAGTSAPVATQSTPPAPPPTVTSPTAAEPAATEPAPAPPSGQ